MFKIAMEVCRSCMKSSENVSHIFAPLGKPKDQSNVPLCMANILNELAGRELISTNDALPQFVCESCKEMAESALKFIRMLETSHQRFANKQVPSNAVKTEIKDEFYDLKSICDMLDFEDLLPSKDMLDFEDFEPTKDMLDFEDLQPTKDKETQEVTSMKTATNDVLTQNVRTRSSTKKQEEYNCLQTRHKIYPPKKDFESIETHKKAEQQSFICEVCNYSLSTKGNLKTHTRIHTGERPFKCTQCPKAFAQMQALTVHTRVHTGESPFKCPKCPMAFKQQSLLLRHFKIYSSHRGKKYKKV